MDDAQSASVFQALADPTRRQVLLDLRDGELAAGEIAAKFPGSGPSVSWHLGILRAAGLVTERRAANRIYSALVTGRLAVCVGEFIASICPGAVVVRSQRAGRAAGGTPMTATVCAAIGTPGPGPATRHGCALGSAALRVADARSGFRRRSGPVRRRMPGVRRLVMTGGYGTCRSRLAPAGLSQGGTRIGATR